MHIAIHLTKKAWHKVKEFWEFSLVGVTSFALMFFMTLAMTELTPLSYRWAYGLGLSSSYTYQFVLNMRLVFTAIDQPVLRIERFIVVAALM
ncbi:TPA: hypothetical protein HA265_07320, partial [Candidatus Woesearchaeota archaeon]|nr:hypothetical protein [Candidatus Woesearchaeota archaeon]